MASYKKTIKIFYKDSTEKEINVTDELVFSVTKDKNFLNNFHIFHNMDMENPSLSDELKNIYNILDDSKIEYISFFLNSIELCSFPMNITRMEYSISDKKRDYHGVLIEYITIYQRNV